MVPDPIMNLLVPISTLLVKQLFWGFVEGAVLDVKLSLENQGTTIFFIYLHNSDSDKKPVISISIDISIIYNFCQELFVVTLTIKNLRP